MYYSLFVFGFYYKIIGLSLKKISRPWALQAAGLPIFGPWVWARPGPETFRLGRASAKY